jgi:hypothetical protein
MWNSPIQSYDAQRNNDNGNTWKTITIFNFYRFNFTASPADSTLVV